ncbi:MAG TPA: septal ring lytic transglycosylase RlpA family protein [Dokdonella sp.]|uniref:septal ring lytic transglycosylase RlpA family protein n=1 Tax=Dokdonella sp. TaxID=2291710 RepID=UPI002D80E634|nr:septal ring lytic transglycosylase RlpA family protein [Dokdonella sp.]HET9033011.1 septal ring lytic transglycosylase RlpA family protein [Dokdonella sp.]
MKSALIAIAVALLLAACARHKPRPQTPASQPSTTVPQPRAVPETSLPQSRRYRESQDGGPSESDVDISKLVEPVPKVEAKSRYGNKSPYSVLGKTYRVMPDAHNYVERGIASWYGNKFHGYMTSSLEPYDMYKFSAAHKSLPLPSYVRVTNLANGKSVVVRVNDRGPFHENRLIDLSYAAAVRIGVWPKGTAMVEVRALNAGELEPAPSNAVSASDIPSRIYVQLGAFADRDNAQRFLARIEQAGLSRANIVTTRINKREIHRVRIGPLASVAEADALVSRIEKLGFGMPRVAIED